MIFFLVQFGNQAVHIAALGGSVGLVDLLCEKYKVDPTCENKVYNEAT